MKKTKNIIPLIISWIILFLLPNCNKDNNTPLPEGGKLKLNIAHYYNNSPIVYHKMQYVNAAGNPIEIYEIQWFLSDIILFPETGSPFNIQKTQEIFYIDNTIPSSLNFELSDIIPPGKYDSIKFTFGMNAQKNVNYLFVNQPESNMEWPDMLGGGFHYMKLDGFWNDPVIGHRAFNFHLGIGRVITTDTQFVQNYFTVTLKDSSFTIIKDKIKEIQIIMNIEEWFKNPNIYDFNFWGDQTMENQQAMEKISQNGRNGVFKVGYIRDIQ